LNEKAYHPTLGMIVATHPDIKHAVELVEFQVGTLTHQHIRSWKRGLRGTIITTSNDERLVLSETFFFKRVAEVRDSPKSLKFFKN
jgi:hypothetical protein